MVIKHEKAGIVFNVTYLQCGIILEFLDAGSVAGVVVALHLPLVADPALQDIRAAAPAIAAVVPSTW